MWKSDSEVQNETQDAIVDGRKEKRKEKIGKRRREAKWNKEKEQAPKYIRQRKVTTKTRRRIRTSSRMVRVMAS